MCILAGKPESGLVAMPFFRRRFCTHGRANSAPVSVVSDISSNITYARSEPPPISRHSADREPQSVVTAKRRNLTCGFKAIGPEAAIGVGTIAVRRAVTRSAILGQLNTVDKLGLLHLAGSYAKVSGFGLNLRHVHALFYYLRCRHLFTPKFFVSQYSSVPYMCILLASIKSE